MSDQDLVTVEEGSDAEEPENIETGSSNSEEEVEIDQSEGPSEKDLSEQLPSSSTKDNGVSESLSILTLKRGQSLTGTVKNIAGFGAFVDIGLPQDGLVHISELARKKVEKVEDVVSVGQEVDVWVKRVDKKRGRISLTMVKPVSLRLRDIERDAELKGTVTRLESYGAFVDIGSERDGLVHISQITHDYIKHPEEALTVGETVQVKVLKVNRKKRQVDLSIKALLPPPEPEAKKEVPQVEETEEAEETEGDESAPTAMALAYAAAMQNKDKSDESEKNADSAEEKHKRKQELDDIITRTLATSE